MWHFRQRKRWFAELWIFGATLSLILTYASLGHQSKKQGFNVLAACS